MPYVVTPQNPGHQPPLCSARQTLQRMKGDSKIYEKLAQSIAPGVCGHENVKRAILLMLFGGVHKQTAEVCPHPLLPLTLRDRIP